MRRRSRPRRPLRSHPTAAPRAERSRDARAPLVGLGLGAQAGHQGAAGAPPPRRRRLGWPARPLRQRGERSGFSALLEASVVHRRALLQLSRSAAALVNNLLRAAMNSWIEGTIARLHATSTLGRAVAALRQRGLRRALNGWLEAAHAHWRRMGLLRSAASPELRGERLPSRTSGVGRDCIGMRHRAEESPPCRIPLQRVVFPGSLYRYAIIS